MPIRLTAVLCSYMLFRFFGPGTVLTALATRNSQLPACRRCRLRARASPTRPRERVQYRRHGAMGTPASYVSLAARHGQCGQAQKANAIRGGAQIFSLLCELASDQRQPTRRPPGYLFSFLCLALLPHFFLLKLLYFDFQLLRKYLLLFH